MTRCPILTFHSIDHSGSVISTSTDQLKRIVGQLAQAGWQGRSVSAALAAWQRDPAARVVGLTFDDGYGNSRDRALPVLADAGFTATVFVIAGRTGLDNRWPGQPASIPTMPLLGWPDLERLVAAGWEVGAHGVEHLPLTAVSADAAVDEIEGGAALIDEHLSLTTRVFAYPYGVSDAAGRAVARRRYAAACGASLAVASSKDLADPFDLPRVDAYYLRRLPVSMLIGSLAGRSYLALRRWARQARRPPWDPRGIY